MTAVGDGAAPTTPTTSPVPVRVVLADDHPMFRFGVAAVLATAPEVLLVGEAASGRELVELVDRVEPDVVLTDLAMPDLDGAAATRELLARRPGLGVLVLTMHDDDESVFQAMRAGARGYLLKGAERAELVRAVLAVAAGDAVFGAAVARRIVDFYTGAQEKYVASAFPDLTARERDVLGLLAEGRRNSDIAARLGLSDKTVRNHVSAILFKLQVPDRTAAAFKARDAGLSS
jgi:DNA-binding NarL/FixJ family response regulator